MERKIIPASNRLFRIVNEEKALATSYSQMKTFMQCPYKWYRQYVDGDVRIEKTEQTSYGSVMHKVAEAFFRGGCMYEGSGLSSLFNYYSGLENIPYESTESMLECGKDAAKFLEWIGNIFKREGLSYKVPRESLDPVEKLLRYGKVMGAEEQFDLKYKLPEETEINGMKIDHVYISGCIDLHTVYSGNTHYLVDWKTGGTLFNEMKLEEDLQFPIYSFYVLRRYGCLPKSCLYFFTRKLESQVVRMDMEKVRKSVETINGILRRMYNFKDYPVKYFHLYKEKEIDGEKKYVMVKAEPTEPMAENMKPCPSKLCAWCRFSPALGGDCLYASDWSPEKEEEDDRGTEVAKRDTSNVERDNRISQEG